MQKVILFVLLSFFSQRAFAQASDPFLAIKQGDYEKVSTLLKTGLDPNLKDAREDSLVIHALRFGRADIRKLLCESGAKDQVCTKAYVRAKSTELIQLVRFNDKAPLQEILDLLLAGADPSFIEPYFTPALHWLISQGRLDAVELLLKNGAQINLRSGTNATESAPALLMALLSNHPDIVEMLLSYGANPALKMANLWNDSSYKIAVASSSPAVLAKLLDHTEPSTISEIPLKSAFYRVESWPRREGEVVRMSADGEKWRLVQKYSCVN